MKVDRETVNQWLEEHRRDRQWLADQCDVGVAAVGHWLNMKGTARPIPAQHQLTIRRLMEEDEAAKQAPPLQNLVLEFEPEEYAAIERAALADPPESIREWAKRILNEAAELDVIEFARAARSIPAQESPPVSFPEVPLLHAAAGSPVSADGDTWAPDRDLGPGRFACQLHGDSMAPRYPDGSVVILRERESLKNPAPKKGQIYLFDLEGEKTLKVYETRLATEEEIESGLSYVSPRDGKTKVPVLRSLNPDFPEIAVRQNVEWIGWLDRQDNR